MSDDHDKNRKRVCAFIESSTRIISARIADLFDTSMEDASEIARDLAHDICAEHGGHYMYVARDMEYVLSKRDLEIYRRFKRGNLHELAKEFGVTHTRIYQIAAQVRKDEIARRQGSLPGMDVPQ